MRKILTLLLAFCMLIPAAYAFDIASNDFLQIRDNSTYTLLVEDDLFVNQVPDPAEPGEHVEVRFKVENLGGETAENVLFRIKPSFPFSHDPGFNGIKRIGDVGVDQLGDDGYVVYYRLRVDPLALEGDTELDAEFSTDGGNTWESAGDFVIRIQDRDALLSVLSVTTEPENVQPGQAFKLHVRLVNRAQLTLGGIKAILDVLEETVLTTSVNTVERPFSPSTGNNEQTIRSLNSGEEVIVTYDLVADADLLSKVYKVPLILAFKDKTGVAYLQESIIGVTVDEDIDYLLNVESSTAYTEGSQGTISISLSNIGNGDIKFATMELHDTDDYRVLSPKLVYLGNIESDDFETADFDIYVTNYQENVPLDIEVGYKDNFNNAQNERSTDHAALPLYTGSEAVRFGLVAAPNIGGILFALAIFVIVVVFILFMVMDLMKTKRKRYERILWFALIVTGLGAVIYFFIGRKKDR